MSIPPGMSEGVVKPGPLDQFEAEVLLPDDSTYSSRGRVNFVSAQIDPSTDQMSARAQCSNVYFSLRVEMEGLQ